MNFLLLATLNCMDGPLDVGRAISHIKSWKKICLFLWPTGTQNYYRKITWRNFNSHMFCFLLSISIWLQKYCSSFHISFDLHLGQKLSCTSIIMLEISSINFLGVSWFQRVLFLHKRIIFSSVIFISMVTQIEKKFIIFLEIQLQD